MLISFLHATFIKIGENDSIHELTSMLQASSKFRFFFIDLTGRGGRGQISVKGFAGLICIMLI